MIRRYTTPYHHFVIPFLAEEINRILLTYSQNGEIIVLKGRGDITIRNINELLDNASMGEDLFALIEPKISSSDELTDCGLLSVRLTQEETSKFTFHKAAEKNIALAQIRIVNTKGDAFVSRPIKIRIYGSTTEGEL